MSTTLLQRSVPLLLLAMAAPAPQPKAWASPEVGVPLKATYAGKPWNVVFHTGGAFSGHYGGMAWVGTWTWNPLTRELIIREWIRYPNMATTHRVILDRNMRGMTWGETGGIRVDLSQK